MTLPYDSLQVRRNNAPDLPVLQTPRAWARAVAELHRTAD